MAISNGLDQHKTSAGPTIDGNPTTLSTFSAQQLRGSPFLPSLLKTINLAYAQAEQAKPELGFGKYDRLTSINEIFVNMREDPESFLVVLSHQDSHDVMATATCRRYFGPDDSKSPWLCSHTVQDGTEEWELKLLATHPSLQGRGAAAFVLEAMEKEITERFATKRKATGNHEVNGAVKAPIKLKMVLCTVQELFPEFYRRRGYREDYVHKRGEGYNFSIMFMSKTLATTS